MRIGIVTREWPPDVYGGAGVHVEHLVAALASLPAGPQLTVHCFGGPRLPSVPGVAVVPHGVPDGLAQANGALQALGIDVGMAAGLGNVDLVHSHTWYANTACLLAALLHGVPHVITAHSLEPRRPWKADQLGGGYRLSSWAERTAYLAADAIVAVSAGMRDDVLAVYPELDPARVHVVHNGVDSDAYRPTPAPDVVRGLGVDPDRPYALFVGRITRQKGLMHLLAAAEHLPADAGLVLCAGAADTPAERQQVAEAVAALQARRSGVVWIEAMLPREQLVPLISGATVFVCPSVYEPLGIVNLEAAACGTAVVASAVGGIPEVVADGRTGLLVPYDAADPRAFEEGLAARTAELLADPARAEAMGAAGRERVLREFGWAAIAHQTVELYASVLAAR